MFKVSSYSKSVHTVYELTISSDKYFKYRTLENGSGGSCKICLNCRIKFINGDFESYEFKQNGMLDQAYIVSDMEFIQKYLPLVYLEIIGKINEHVSAIIHAHSIYFKALTDLDNITINSPQLDIT